MAEPYSYSERVGIIAAERDYGSLRSLSGDIGATMAWTLVEPERAEPLAELPEICVEDRLTHQVVQSLGEIAAVCAETRDLVLANENRISDAINDPRQLPLGRIGVGFGLVSDAIIEQGLLQGLSVNKGDDDMNVVDYLSTTHEAFRMQRRGIAESIASQQTPDDEPAGISEINALYALLLAGPLSPQELAQFTGAQGDPVRTMALAKLVDRSDHMRQDAGPLSPKRGGDISLVPDDRVWVLRSLLQTTREE